MTSLIEPSTSPTVQEKRRLLEQLLRDRLTQKLVQRESAGDPLSVGQQALWFLNQFDPGNGSYNIGHGLILRSELDPAALQTAVDRLVERHPALRTTFRTGEHGPESVVHDRATVRIADFDGSGLDDDAVVTALAAEADRPFDLTTGPLLRITRCRRDADSTMLMLVLHHIVGEFWSLVIVVRDLLELYGAEVAGRPARLPILTADYADFARWQRTLLDSEEANRLADYWLAQMAGPLPVLDLPTDRPRPPEKTHRGGQRSFDLGAAVSAAVKDFAAHKGVTLYTTLLATFGAFLSRYSGQRDLVIGAPMTGRTESRWTDVVGFFDNPLPLRMTLDVGTTFEELVAKAHAIVLGAFEHQAMPFSTLVEKLQPVRDPSRSPLFDVMFVLRRAQAGRLQTLAAADMGENAGTVALGSGISAEPLDLDRHTSQFDLSLSVTEVGSELRAVWEFNRDLFDDATIDRMSGHFRAFLDGLVSAPDTPVAVVPLLPTDEQRQALVEWNATDAPLDESATLIDGFLEQVSTHPELLAVVAGETRLSYAELYDRAARIAKWLRTSGARPNTLVAVVMTKGWEQVAATLGVQMAGAAYLPLDPGLPIERLRHLLDVGEVELLLTTPDREQDLGWTAPRPMLLVDDHSLAQWPVDPPAAPPGHHDLAYVIFTSGSTGVPKGVAIDHAGAVNTINDINERFQIGVGDRVLGLSALSFDLSVWDIFGTLAAGATLILPDARSTQDPVHWLELARREHVTVWNSVPMLLKLLVDELDQDAHPAMDGLESLRLAMLSGDWIPVTLPDQVWSHLPDISLVSLGGATEVSIWSILHPITSVDPGQSSIPYGRPMRNQQIYVLDDGYSPCPIGVTGRLFIGGVGLAREYWRDDARTSASFPTSPRTGQRLYHTGDLGRYLPDGTIEFLGRADHQVKVRGFRVELGEVEAALLAHPGVREAAVAARGRSGENRLIGYVVGVTDADALDLRDWCAARLPDYMVPAVIEVLDELPLSSNGKVDRGKLPEPGLSRRVPPPESARPRGERETLLADIWTELLRVEPIGRDENFFELGGDSVLAMRCCTRLRQDGLQLTPRMIFEHPTIARLAELATAAPAARGADPQRSDLHGIGLQGIGLQGFDLQGFDTDRIDTDRVDTDRADTSGALAPMQQTMLLHKLYDTSPGLYVEHVIVELTGEIDVATLSRACAAVTGRHGVLRSAFRWDGLPAPVRVELPAEPDPIDVLDWTGLDEAAAAAGLTAIVEHDRAAGFDLTEPPLMTWRLVHRGPGRWDLVWAHSHLIVDGWSITLVLRELLADYRALSAGHAPAARSSARYEDFLAWLGRQDRDGAQHFWQQELAGFHAPTALPMLQPLSANGFRHGQRSRRTAAGAAQRLTEFTRSRAVTLGSLVQAAWAILLARYSGEDDVLFGLTVSGRPAELVGVEDMVGLFINTVPLRLQVPADAEVGAWLATVQARQMNLRDHDHVSLSDIEGWSDMPRSSRSFSLFDTILVVENYPVDDDATDTAGLRIGQVRFDEQSNTPLMLYVIPGAGDLELRATFDASRLSEAAADRLLGHLEELMTGMAASPTGRVRDLRMLPEGELAGLPGRAALDPAPAADATLHGLVAAIADTNPDAVAVAEPGREISYGRLWCSAVAEADRLRSLGCGPGSTVAVLVERSAEVILAQLAVLIAGAAYVPLDPAQPARYIETVLRDAGAAVALAGAGLERRLPSGTRVLSPTWLDGPDAEQVAAASRGPDSSGQAAYVIYTSGSTGKPKGVVIEHGAARSFVAAAIDRYGVAATDRVLQFCSLGFDASVEEIYVTLAAGATVVPRSEAMVQSISGFLDGCARSGVTVLDLPTAFWHELVLAMAGGAALPASVRMVIVGGERLLPNRLAQWRRHAPAGVRLLNTYGPTEAAVVATMAVLAGGTDGAGVGAGTEVQGPAIDDDPDAAVPIGHPLPNSAAHVVDIHGQPAPVEVPGELLIGGHGLAREYLGLPQLTAEAFGAHPSDPTAGRVYATGDLVLRRADGSLSYVGRRDEQIKISGFRVEPAGIESVLEEHPDIRSAVVVPSLQAQGTRLVAHVVPINGASRPTDRELRSFLADRLAVHLLPASYVWLDDLPRSPAGKIDRKALRESVVAPAALPAAASCSPLEAELLGVWSSVLGTAVGVDDNFFDLGGQSLQTLQLVQRLSSTLGIEVPVREIFVHPTVSALARELSATGRGLGRTGAGLSAGPAAEPATATEQPFVVEATPHCVTENRPLLGLFAAGRLPPVDSAALTYLPADITDAAGIGRERVLGEWFGGLPLVHDVLETPLGRLAVIAIPRFSDELYVGQETLVDQLREAVSIAGFVGAKVVSLTGLIPSAIDGGRALPAGPPGSPRVTTGRLTTAAAVALNVERLLFDAGRSPAAERLAVLGLGSIGSATLRLLLDCLPHPAEIILADVYDQAEHLEALRHGVIHQHGYRGRVRVLTGHGEPAAELYRASLIVGATNAPDILDVDRLAPGCIVVDDSAPHCFSLSQAAARIERHGDILVTEGGFVESPTALQRTQYWPASTAGLPMIEPIRRWRRHHPTRVTGCMLAGLLEDLDPVGDPSHPSWNVKSESARAHFDALVAEGFTGAAAHTEKGDLDPALVASFRDRFGADETEQEAS